MGSLALDASLFFTGVPTILRGILDSLRPRERKETKEKLSMQLLDD
jgi:hypothetical protein